MPSHSHPAPMQVSASHSGDSSFSTASTLNDSQTSAKQYSSGDDARIWIPAQHSNRTLILCFDGTGDQFDSDNSNVVQLVAMLKKDETSQQLVYYQPGIGTYTDPKAGDSIFKSVYETLDEAVAIYLPDHVKEGYTFLMQNYTYGDKICIFGFSRGAYTARCLAGMLQKVGLLPVYNFQQVPFAYQMFKREDDEGLVLCDNFKRTFCRHVQVEFLGVWDTVASVGLIPTYLPFTTENNGIRCLRHALSLDERRIKFLPSYALDPHTLKAQAQAQAQQQQQQNQQNGKRPTLKGSRLGESDSKIFEDRENAKERPTDLLEVWFAGVHADVGGGSVQNDTAHALARIPLRWMIRECFRCKTGIIFDAVMLQKLGLTIVNTPSGPVLGDVPARIPGSTNNAAAAPPPSSGLLASAASLLWSAISAPFVALSSLFTSSTPTKPPRRLKPMHSADVDYVLRDDLPADYESEQELHDSRCRLYDQLQASLMYRVMEYLPMRVKKQRAIVEELDRADGFMWVLNMGRGRKIFKTEMREGMKVHRSVKTRLEAGVLHGALYVPKVRPHILKDVGARALPVKLGHQEWNVDDPVHWQWVD